MQSVTTLENIVNRLPGIQGAKVLAEDDEIREIHVLADAEKPAKQIVRDIETAIFAASGTRIDRKIVSVAQLSSATETRDHEEDDEAQLEDSYHETSHDVSRFNLVSVQTSTDTRKMSITVVIDDSGTRLSGSSVVDVKDDEKYMAVVEATVAAVRSSLPSFRVEFFERLKYGLSEVFLAVASSVSGGKREKEASARMCRKDSFNDIVLVLLEALNKI